MNTTKSPKEAESGGNHLLLDLHNHHNNNDKSKAASSSSSSAAAAAQWLRLKDPRIVRVSRALGGKDRHSKVCTVRGLRDRRVRLSVPTAIQLYDLQDRLGLNQPSKVVDWLLNVAKNEIDELPPLQIPPGSSLSLCQYPPSLTIPNCNNINKDSNNNNHHEEEEEEEEDGNIGSQGNNNEEDHHRHNNNNHHHHHHPSFLGLLNNFPSSSSSSLGYNINQWEHHHQANNNNNSSGFVTNADLLLQASQILVCPPSSSSSSSQPYFPNSQHIASIHDHMDPRQINQYHQMLMSSSSSLTISHHQRNLLSNALSSSLYPVSMSQSVKPFSLSMMTPPNTRENQSHNKDQDFPSK